jgi:hypothetical protein
MTTYYKGNNIGLSFDGTGWSFNNLPQNFIDPDAFSTPDPVFPTAPTETTTPDDSTPDPCPPGYVYDETLKQCVPDPNYQNPFRQDNNQGGGQDDNTGSPELPSFPNIEQYQPGVTGGRSYVPTEDSGIDYSIFNYSTLPSERQSKTMNEFMLISYGIDKGYLSYDDEKDAYRKIQFKESITPNERRVIDNNWALSLLSADNYRNYRDYFDLLENGYKNSTSENVFKKFFSPKNNLDGNMIFKEKSTRGGRLGYVTYVNFSDDFKKKINQAMSIKDKQGNVKGIIDREGNVNVRADDQGGYYNSDGKFISGTTGQVTGGSLIQGMQYLINLQNSGIQLSPKLQKRLLKGINSKALSFKQKQDYANILGYDTWDNAYKDLSKAVSDDNWWKKDDDAIIPLKDTAPTPISTEGDIVSDDGTITDPSGDTYTPTGDGQGYTFESGSDTSYTPGGQGSGTTYNPSGSGGTSYGTGRGGTSKTKTPSQTSGAPANYGGNIPPATGNTPGFSGNPFIDR